MAVLPKCPLCLAAYGSLFASGPVASFVTGPLALILASTSFALFAWLAFAHGRRVFGIAGGIAVVLIYVAGRGMSSTAASWSGVLVLLAGAVLDLKKRTKSLTSAMQGEPMTESMIGRSVYVCDCGPSCRCEHHSAEPSNCACGTPTVKRKILAEDARRFYVAETGHPDARDELGDKPFTTADGRALQGFGKA